jgi:hypothetical protein
VRKTIRRGLFVTATAVVALVGFGLAQASAEGLPVSTPGMSDVSVAGLPGGSPELPGLNVVPNFGGTNVDGVELPNLPLGSDESLPSLDSVQQGSALDGTGFVTKTVPTLNVLRLLPIG